MVVEKMVPGQNQNKQISHFFTNKKNRILIALILISIFVLINITFGIFMYKRSLSRQSLNKTINQTTITPTVSPNPTITSSEKSCKTDTDCPSGSQCVTAGPIIANQAPHKVCTQEGKAVPL